VDTSPGEPRPLAKAFAGLAIGWIFWRKFNRRGELEAEHPKWIMADVPRTDQLKRVALQVAAEIHDDADAVTAIRGTGGKPKELRVAAAFMRSESFTWEHRKDLRAARLLKAAADGGSPVPPSSDQEALFLAVERLEALSLEEAIASLAVAVPSLRALEQQIDMWLSEPEWADRDADDRVASILGELAQIIGPRASTGSALTQSTAAFDIAHAYLLSKADLLIDDDEEMIP
jgi:hypothetical protein